MLPNGLVTLVKLCNWRVALTVAFLSKYGINTEFCKFIISSRIYAKTLTPYSVYNVERHQSISSSTTCHSPRIGKSSCCFQLRPQAYRDLILSPSSNAVNVAMASLTTSILDFDDYPDLLTTHDLQGIQLGIPEMGVDIRFPLTVSQCEPVLIYYNTRHIHDDQYPALLNFTSPTDHQSFQVLDFPLGAGYMEWICNIAAGYSFLVSSHITHQYFVAGDSSALCLQQYGQTATSPLDSLLRADPVTTMLPLPSAPTVSFPTDSLPTVTVNPGQMLTTPQPLPSGRSATKKSVVVGCGIGGGLVLLFAFLFWVAFRRKIRNNVHIEEVEISDRRRVSVPAVRHQQHDPSSSFLSLSDHEVYAASMSASDLPVQIPTACDTVPYPSPRSRVPNFADFANTGTPVPSTKDRSKKKPKLNASESPPVPPGGESGPSRPTPAAKSFQGETVANASENSPQRSEVPGDPSEVIATLNSFSRLNNREKRAVVSMLNHLVPLDGRRRRNTVVSVLPPYPG